jgi:hypothetical protein
VTASDVAYDAAGDITYDVTGDVTRCRAFPRPGG